MEGKHGSETLRKPRETCGTCSLWLPYLGLLTWILTGECIGLLTTWGTVQVDDNVHAKVGSLFDHCIQIGELASSIWEGLVAIDDGRVRPVANWNTDSVQTSIVDILNRVGCDPVRPMGRESVIAGLLVATSVVVLHAIRLGRTAHGRRGAAIVAGNTTSEAPFPRIAYHPWLSNQPA